MILYLFRHYPQTVTGAYLSGVREAARIFTLEHRKRNPESKFYSDSVIEPQLKSFLPQVWLQKRKIMIKIHFRNVKAKLLKQNRRRKKLNAENRSLFLPCSSFTENNHSWLTVPSSSKAKSTSLPHTASFIFFGIHSLLPDLLIFFYF